MRHLLLLLLTTGSSVVFSQNQPENQPIRIQPNGVQVFEAKGNEGPVVTIEPKTVVSKSINDWSLVECQDALYYIDLKIQLLMDSGNQLDRIAAYNHQKALILERKQFLISNN